MTLSAYGLRVDGQLAAAGVVCAPRFSWRLESERRGARQSGYRIMVRQLLPGGQSAPAWDSGAIESSDTTGIAYGGAPLVSSARYEWVLAIRDDQGGESTATGGFSTGIVHADQWTAAWIGRNPHFVQVALPPQDTDISYTVNKLQPVRRFVRHFDLDRVPDRATVHASAQGVYRLYVNGQRVGSDELVPGWTEYDERITYQSHDVTAHLRPGRNSIAALLGDGWYVGFIGTDRRHQAQHYGTQPALLVQLELDRPDGGREVIATDESWHESASDILYADMLMGQYEDSRRAEPDWHRPEFDVSGWLPAQVTSRDHSRLTPEVDPAVRVTDRLSAVSVVRRDADTHIVDFGQNLVGRVALTLRDQPAGTRIQLSHAEVLDDDGGLYTANLRTAEPVDVFWTDGSAEQVFEPRFTLHGFRYAEVTGHVGELAAEDIAAIVLHNDFTRTGTIRTSSAPLNRLAENIWWGLRGNFVSVPTDCPQRDERLGWLADAQVFAPTALAYADLAPLLARWMRDVRTGQTADGAFRDIAPLLVHKREGAPAWGDGGVTVPWNTYVATGDLSVLAEAADSMIAWVRHIQRHNPDLLWRAQVGNNYGDWLQLGEETPKDVVATAYFAWSTTLTARSLRLLGRIAEAVELEELATQIAAAYAAEFIAADGTVAGDSQGAYLLTLAFGLCPDELRTAVADRLVRAVERRDVSLTTGFVTVGLLCPVLTSIGRGDLAVALLLNDRYPSWLFSVRNGATTIWERWDGWTPEAGFQSARMNSFNHYSLGSVGAWLFSGLAGIDQGAASAGYRDLVLAPVVDARLSWVEAEMDTARGRIASAWRIQDAGVAWSVQIPPGDAATVVFPGVDVSAITEGGESATRSEGITLLPSDEGRIRMRVESGRYDFRFPRD